MRLSCREQDPGFQEPHITRKATVYLDGTEIHGVVTADEELRFVEVYALDAQGKHIMEGDEVRTVKRYGRVQIEIDGLREKTLGREI